MRVLRGQVLIAFVIAATSCAHRPPMGVQALASSCQQVVPESTRAITWIAPNDARDRDHLGKWCQTVGPVVVDSPRQSAAAIVDRLAIISWNVHVGGGDIEDLVGRLRRGEFSGGDAVSDFVLLLQEAYREGADVPAQFPVGSPLPRPIVERPPSGIRLDIRSIAARLGLHLFYAPAMRNNSVQRLASPEDRGLAILSTLPLGDPQVIELPFERQRRIAMSAMLSGRTSSGLGWRLRAANVQIDTSLAVTRGGPIAARRRQAEALIEALAAEGGADQLPAAPDTTTSIVLGGDFNTWFGGKEPAVEVMRRAFPDTPLTANGATWRGPLGARAALDHVFIRGRFRSATTRRLSSRFGSDHYPLSTLLVFN
jgi:endonuclease/exonuclease/phosphatase family metal-dependent hydrolase